MAKLKEKGHNINLTNIIVHKINKTSGNKDSVLKLAENELKVNKQEIYFIADIRESFSKRSVPTYGIFEDEFSFNVFQQSLKDYKENAIDFLDFTVKSMGYYKRVIESSAPASGGFIIFADFKITDNNDERYILVFSINNKQGYNLNEEALSIQQIKNLELNKIDLASLINITRWDLSIANKEEVKTYLAFIRGKKKISDYFQSFIGCADKTTATESSTRLKDAVHSYCIESGFDDAKTKDTKRKVYDYCQDCKKNKKEIQLAHISSIIDDENPNAFSEYASNEKFSVSEIIKYDSKILRTLKFVEYQSEDFSIKLNKQMIGKTAKINKEKKTLTLTNIPDELLSQF
ncbi:MAG: hypothetical protein BGO86_05750 [Chryseobacterium sp. 36-9]|nr:MAG: hypothetical protein BGO86_05750 [Chryseobacterium sp. 36-9]